MFVYYKLYREPVSPTILTPQCGDQKKKNGCAREGNESLTAIYVRVALNLDREMGESAGGFSHSEPARQ